MIASRFPILVIVIVAYLLAAADSCDSVKEDKASSESFLSMEQIEAMNQSLETEYLSEEMKYALLEKAKIKLLEFYDYTNICSDKTIDSTFRNNAALLLRDLLASKDVKISVALADGNSINYSLDQFISMQNSEETDHFLHDVDSLSANKFLEREENNLYHGELSYLLIIHQLSDGDTILYSRTNRYCEVYVTKDTIETGPDPILIWKTFLGSIH